jgi:hypothetical protein
MTPRPQVEHLSTHLTVPEFLHTQVRQYLDEQDASWAENTALRAHGERFATSVFERVRPITGPLLVTSGYRCPRLNTFVGGQPASHHLLGLAADVVPLNMRLVAAMVAIQGELQAGALPDVDQVIFEFGRWIHVQAALSSAPPRHVCLMTFEGGSYSGFDPADPRVVARRNA